MRVPAHFCGVAGFKPTLDLLPMRGIATGIAALAAVEDEVRRDADFPRTPHLPGEP